MLKNLILFHIFLFLLCTFCKNNSTSPNKENPDNIILASDISAGEVKGKMVKTNSPYRVNGDITIPSGRTLTIEPGVEVIFQGHYKCNVQGRLLANGSHQDTIIFTASSIDTGWYGIRFNKPRDTNDSSKLIYCKIQYGRAIGSDDLIGGGIFIDNFNKVIINNCLITQNKTYGDINTGGGGIGIVDSSPTIVNTCISYNSAHGGHGGGIFVVGNSYPIVNNNNIFKNMAYGGGGITCYQCNPVLINNTITENTADHGGAIDCITTSPLFFNTILYGNNASTGSQVHIASPGEPNFYFCDVEGGTKNFARDHVNGGRYDGTYMSNIETDPVFLNPASGYYQLSDSSPCIGAGADSIQISNNHYSAPDLDFEGNPRPNPVNSSPDIGAFENALGTPSTGIKLKL